MVRQATGTGRSTTTATRTRRAAETQELPDYCARPACRQAFTRVVGPGRPQAYCSELCRRSAERELRQTQSRLTHFESLVAQLRVDVAAFSPSTTSDLEVGASPQAQRAAEDAVTRVAGILAFLGDSPDPLAAELRALHEAVAPVVTRTRLAS